MTYIDRTGEGRRRELELLEMLNGGHLSDVPGTWRTNNQQDRYALDFTVAFPGRRDILADLKTINSPMYRARQKFEIPPDRCVGLNRAAEGEYTKIYYKLRQPIYLVFWLRWTGGTRYGVEVSWANRLYIVDFASIAERIIHPDRRRRPHAGLSEKMEIMWQLDTNDMTPLGQWRGPQ